MPIRNRVFVILSFIFILLLSSASSAFAQQPLLQKKISGSFTDVALVNALRKIASQNNLKFSYNPELIKPSRRVSIRYSNQSIGDVLKLILNDPTLSFREIGNQIVIYRVGDPPSKVEVTQLVSPDKIVPNTRKSPDTVFVYRLDTLILNRIDTVFRSISITRFDTIRIFDTVYREKIKTQKVTPTKKNPFGNNSMRHKKYLQNNGFYAGLYLSWLPGNISLNSTENAEYLALSKAAISPHLSSYEAGFVLGYDYYKVGLRSGIGLIRLSEQFNYSYLDESGAFYKKDTVEKYYLEPIGLDTTWIYICDSTWIPKETTEYNYKNLNSYHYLSLPLSIKFRFVQKDMFDLYALAGLNAQFLLRSKALYMLPNERYRADWVSNTQLQPIILSYHAGLGASFKLGNSAGFFTEAIYRSQITNQMQNVPLEKRFNLIDIKVGTYVKF